VKLKQAQAICQVFLKINEVWFEKVQTHAVLAKKSNFFRTFKKVSVTKSLFLEIHSCKIFVFDLVQNMKKK